MSERYLALLRGINVGGKNLIGKEDLRRCLEELGFERVRTYIQSGNVLFRAAAADLAELNARVEQELSDRFARRALGGPVAPATRPRSTPRRRNGGRTMATTTLAGVTLLASLSGQAGHRHDRCPRRRVLVGREGPHHPFGLHEAAQPPRLPAGDDPQPQHGAQARRSAGGAVAGHPARLGDRCS